MISDALAGQGHQVQRYRPYEVDTACTANLTHRIKQGDLNLRWAFTPNRRLVKRRWTAYLATILSCCALIAGSGGSYFIYGPGNGAWNEPELAAMLRDLGGNVTTHQLCHFGLSLQPQGFEARSRVQVRRVTNCRLSNSGCRCGPGHRHVMDWTSAEPSFRPAQTKEKILAHIAGALVSHEWGWRSDQTALEQAPDCKGTTNTTSLHAWICRLQVDVDTNCTTRHRHSLWYDHRYVKRYAKHHELSHLQVTPSTPTLRSTVSARRNLRRSERR